MQEENEIQDDNLKGLYYCLDHSSDRLRLYSKTNNSKYLEDSRNFLKVADIYIRRLIHETH